MQQIREEKGRTPHLHKKSTSQELSLGEAPGPVPVHSASQMHASTNVVHTHVDGSCVRHTASRAHHGAWHASRSEQRHVKLDHHAHGDHDVRLDMVSDALDKNELLWNELITIIHDETRRTYNSMLFNTEPKLTFHAEMLHGQVIQLATPDKLPVVTQRYVERCIHIVVTSSSESIAMTVVCREANRDNTARNTTNMAGYVERYE